MGGCAVGRRGFRVGSGQLLKLPAFMTNRRLDVSDQDVLDGLALTGYFLQNRVIASVGGNALPDARARLVDLIRRRS